MGSTVYVNGRSVVHKNAGGKSIAFPDPCLSPPPPPAGPLPLPYPNTAMASDTDEGASSVKADGQPVAIKGQSKIKTSSGDEGGTQGGNVVTHKTKGKAFFLVASTDVKIEGKAVPRHGDSMAQNCACAPFGGVAPAYVDLIAQALEDTNCEEPYVRGVHGRDSQGRRTPNEDQTAAINNMRCDEATEFQPAGTVICWECQEPTANPIADHQPPLVLKYYSGGCNDPDDQLDLAESDNYLADPPEENENSIVPHCPDCSTRQMNEMSRFSRAARAAQGL